MRPGHAPPRFLVQWLIGASALVAVFGGLLVIAPVAARQGFSQLIYGNLTVIDSFGTEAAHYIALAHAVIGSVMVGWGIAMVLITRHLIAVGSRLGWRMLNAVLNTEFAALFLIPLVLLRPDLRDGT